MTRICNAPIRITLKTNRDSNSFEIINSPQNSPSSNNEEEEESVPNLDLRLDETNCELGDGESEINKDATEEIEDVNNISFSPNFLTENFEEEIEQEEEQEISEEQTEEVTALEVNPLCGEEIENASASDENSDYGSVPGAEPTPPPDASPEPSTDYPKIRIKSGLLKERLTITEITEDNPTGEFKSVDLNRKDSFPQSGDWTTPLEDPLRLTDPLALDKDDGKLISSLFNNHNDRAKDLGFTTSDSEFISMDRLEERNRNAMAIYSSNKQSMSQNPLDSLAGLPMQQLAQQVSRLQPNNGMHQQNVLINIQQFPQAPPQPQHHAYQAPMYPHPQPMYQPYQSYQ